MFRVTDVRDGLCYELLGHNLVKEGGSVAPFIGKIVLFFFHNTNYIIYSLYNHTIIYTGRCSFIESRHTYLYFCDDMLLQLYMNC